jgi:hypothetical protein
MTFAALQSVMNTPVVNTLGCLHPPWSHCFQLTCAVFPKVSSPAFAKKQVHPLRSLALSSEYVADPVPPNRSEERSSASRGISSPIATSAPRIHLDGELPTTHLSSALSVSHTPDGLLPAEPCGLVSSRCHVWGSPFKGFPCCQADPPRRSLVPSCRFPTFVSQRPKPLMPTPASAPTGL